MNCNTTHYRANSSSVPGDPTLLVVARALRKTPLFVPTAGLALAMAVLLLPPLFWTKSVLGTTGNATLPYVSPGSASGGGFSDGPGAGGNRTNPALIEYLQANRGDAKFLVATQSSMDAAPIIISTGEAVMAMGGFSGGDPALTTPSLADLVENGTVRFFLLQGAGLGGRPDGTPTGDRPASTQPELRSDGTAPAPTPGGAIDGGTPGLAGRGVSQSVIQACEVVDASSYSGQTTGAVTAGSLYDCQGKAEAIRATGGN